MAGMHWSSFTKMEFDAERLGVRFFAVDGHTSVSFLVTSEALMDRDFSMLGPDAKQTLLAAFERHKDRVREAAQQLYEDAQPSRHRADHF